MGSWTSNSKFNLRNHSRTTPLPPIVLPLALQPPPKSFNMFSTKLLAVFSLIVALCNAQTPTDVSDASSQNISFLVLAVVMLQLFLTVSAQTPTDVSSAVGLVPGALVVVATSLLGLFYLL